MIFIAFDVQFNFTQVLLIEFLCMSNCLLIKIGLKRSFNKNYHSEPLTLLFNYRRPIAIETPY
jgi:hypothetical protein